MKKKNPNTMVSQKEVDKAYHKALRDASAHAFVMIFSVMHDKHGWGRIRLNRLYKQVDALSQSIAERYVKYTDLEKTLRDELGIRFVD